MFTRLFMLFFLLMLAFPLAPHAAQKPDDGEALTGLKKVMVIFDVRVPDLEKLTFNLNLFNETFEGLVSRGIKPEMIVAFRGPGVKLLTTASLDNETRDLIKALKKRGVKFEACAVAMRIFKADPAGLIPEVRLVANGFYSLIGYQNKGYAMIAIN